MIDSVTSVGGRRQWCERLRLRKTNDGEIKEYYGFEIISKRRGKRQEEMDAAGKVWHAYIKKWWKEAKHTAIVNTERGFAVWWIIEAGGYSAWEGVAHYISPTLFVMWHWMVQTVCRTDMGNKEVLVKCEMRVEKTLKSRLNILNNLLRIL